jgi:NADH dehydrogenase [ubiquinone] 1 alpha subcomplex assembly factor 7
MPSRADQDVTERLRRRILEQGPIPVADYMATANAHYYDVHTSLGAEGDFTTAPEISQMFGELVGIWMSDLWIRSGRPATRYVELGPGRGTLARDALRAMRGAGLEPPVELVETSRRLRSEQAQLLAAPRWHEDISSLPDDSPLLVIANEFFDALPVRQFDRLGEELLVSWEGGAFVRRGEVEREVSPTSIKIIAALAGKLVRQGGAALIVDYGHRLSGFGDTLQAVSRHAYADPWQAPGSRDLTAHVDFQALASAARASGADTYGPVPQGLWLEEMGIGVRAAALAQAMPERSAEIECARERLVEPEQMGRLFKVMAMVAPDWPEPAGFG